jgi:magnesium transporter
VTDADGSAGPASAAPPDRAANALRVPCLHNPSRHEVDFHLASQDFVWIDLEGPSDDDLNQVAEHIKLHPLTLEDARTFQQRPKIEDYDDYVFMVAFGADPEAASGDRLLREVHLIISGDAVVTIHRHPDESLDALRRRYHDQPVRSKLFLIYQILDAVIATFIPVLSRVDDDIDDIEEQVINQPREEDLKRIFSIKRDLVAMRRVVAPMRDMFLRRSDHLMELPGLQDDDKLYFRDLYDGLIRTSEMVDAYRDLLSGATDLYLSTVANRQGEVNRQLTIIATIFLPLTFFTGFFGQNFSLLTDHLINHNWTFWVFGVALLVVSVVGFAIFFRRKGWLGPDATGGAAKTTPTPTPTPTPTN